MVFAVPDVDATIISSEYSVGSRELAGCALSIWPIASLAVSCDTSHDVCGGFDHPNAVAFRISEPDIPLWIQTDSFGA